MSETKPVLDDLESDGTGDPLDQDDANLLQTNTEFEPESESDDDTVVGATGLAFSPINFNVTNRRIGDIFSSKNDGELETTPAFQRGYVWDRLKASKLIESVLLHVPLPLIYTAEEPDGKEVVIDGQQRLMTFIGFMHGKFPKDEKPFKLTNLKILTHLNGLSYADFDADLKFSFKRYGVSIIRIANTTQESVKFEIFERLNTGAVTLSAQELRNCIYRGSFNELIKELAPTPAFKRVLATKQPLQRMVDCEMVLRFFTFYERTHINYNGKMKTFMNDFMEANRDIAPEKADEWKIKFFLACDNVFTVFGDRAFRRFRGGSNKDKRGVWENPINKALFDCVMFWFARYEKRQIVASKDAIREAFIHLMANEPDFQDAITLGTSDVSRVKTRFTMVKDVLDKAITVQAGERRAFSIRERTDLFKADPTCAFCGQRIESLDDADVDHRIKFAEGGSTNLSNARIAHRYCNRASGGS